MFVNSIIVSMKAHVNQANLTVYQVGSSYRNPVTFQEMHDLHYNYFAKHPWTNREGNPVKVGKGVVLNNIFIFEIILFLWHYLLQMVSKLNLIILLFLFLLFFFIIMVIYSLNTLT